MSGPKHLWSGDWEDESAASSRERADLRPRPARPEPTPAPVSRPRRLSASTRRALPLALLALLIVAAGAWAITRLGSSHPQPARKTAGGFSLPTTPNAQSVPTPNAPSVPTPTTPAAPPVTPAPAVATPLPRPVYWLGMEIQTLPPGAAVIETVTPRSPAGLGPGDVIVEINHRPINGTSDIAPAIRGLAAGDVVTMQVAHGSGFYGTEATLAAPPSLSP